MHDELARFLAEGKVRTLCRFAAAKNMVASWILEHLDDDLVQAVYNWSGERDTTTFVHDDLGPSYADLCGRLWKYAHEQAMDLDPPEESWDSFYTCYECYAFVSDLVVAAFASNKLRAIEAKKHKLAALRQEAARLEQELAEEQESTT